MKIRIIHGRARALANIERIAVAEAEEQLLATAKTKGSAVAEVTKVLIETLTQTRITDVQMQFANGTQLRVLYNGEVALDVTREFFSELEKKKSLEVTLINPRDTSYLYTFDIKS